MYLIPLKTLLVQALRQTFDDQYPSPDFRGLYASIEYPVEPQAYPSVWVDYDDTAPLTRAGVSHRETLEVQTGGDPLVVPYTRFRFEGSVSLTVVALSSLERDRLYDELVRVLAFGDEDAATVQFRRYIEDNEFIAANMNFDTLTARGNAAAPGTPWGTEEVIYERGLSVEIIGEFVADRTTGALVPLTRIEVAAVVDTTTEEQVPDLPDPDAPTTDWH